MKKSALVVIISSVFLIFSVSTTFAGYRHYRSYHHHGHGAIDVLVPLGFGLIAGAIIAGSAAPPPPRTVIYRQAPPPVIVSPPVEYYNYSAPPPAEELVINQVNITAGLLNVRSGPGLETPIIDQVRRGEILDVIGASPGWLYVRTSSGQHGWVMSKFTTVSMTPAG